MTSPRMTLQTQMVLRALLCDPTAPVYGLELADVVGLPPGTVYPILARLEGAGWVRSAWEDPSVHTSAGRPRRRYYRIDPDGAAGARDALARCARPRSRVHRFIAGPAPEVSR